MLFFSYSLFIWWIIFIYFGILNTASISWSLLDVGGWSFRCFLGFSLQVSYWEFFIYLHKENWTVLFFIDSLFGLDIRMAKELGNLTSVTFKGIIWEVLALILWKSCIICVKAICSGLLGGWLFTVYFSDLDIDLFKLLIWFFIFYILQFGGIQVVKICAYDSMYFYVVWCHVPFYLTK